MRDKVFISNVFRLNLDIDFKDKFLYIKSNYTDFFCSLNEMFYFRLFKNIELNSELTIILTPPAEMKCILRRRASGYERALCPVGVAAQLTCVH